MKAVILTFPNPLSADDADRVAKSLEDHFPGVRFALVDNCGGATVVDIPDGQPELRTEDE